jgi:hypothetical protein
MIRALVPLALLANGIAAGIMLGNAIGPGALALTLPYGRYVSLIKFMWPRYDPLVPILNVVALLCDLVVVVRPGDRNPASVRGLFGLSAALLAVLIVISLTKNVPINRYVTGLDPAQQPADWAERDPRDSWLRWNRLRVALSLAALFGGVGGVAVLM